MDNHLILPACYLPPVSYFHTIQATSLPILIEQYEHYPKQTYRTRASIYSANGKLDLIVPVQRGHKGHTKMKDVKISYEWDWQRLHWMSLQTAYRSSAYFEYYEDDFLPFYRQRYDWLVDYNVAQLELLLRLLKIARTVGYTESYRQDYPPHLDFRSSIHPKRDSPVASHKPYYQVFENKCGFLANLSVVDLLFNHGPQSKEFL
ncbi:WbqC family protein [Parapedobacter sp. GCM10030251]|jgi:WbqC-like protein family.|uniref:WbqC family protein n=1 Tax=Parapedobacter sp. GCM10030251 TaxID=3273419 RepID=UPI0036066760